MGNTSTASPLEQTANERLDRLERLPLQAGLARQKRNDCATGSTNRRLNHPLPYARVGRTWLLPPLIYPKTQFEVFCSEIGYKYRKVARRVDFCMVNRVGMSFAIQTSVTYGTCRRDLQRFSGVGYVGPIAKNWLAR